MLSRTLASLSFAVVATACTMSGENGSEGSWWPALGAGDQAARSNERTAGEIRPAQFQQRPGQSEPLPPRAVPPVDPLAVQPPSSEAFPGDFTPIPDRWRIVEGLGVNERFIDPFNENTWKGDRPVYEDYFVVLTAISDTIIEPRSVPTPVGIQGDNPGSNDVFGDSESSSSVRRCSPASR